MILFQKIESSYLKSEIYFDPIELMLNPKKTEILIFHKNEIESITIENFPELLSVTS